MTSRTTGSSSTTRIRCWAPTREIVRRDPYGCLSARKGTRNGPAGSMGRMRWKLTVAGLAATCATVLVAAVVHVLVYSVAFPPEAIAQRAVGITSGRVDSFFIDLLGHWAQRLTVIGLSVAFAVSGALLAHVFPRRWLRHPAAWAIVPIPVWAFSVAVYSAPAPFLGRWAFAGATFPIFAAGGVLGGVTFERI